MKGFTIVLLIILVATIATIPLIGHWYQEQIEFGEECLTMIGTLQGQVLTLQAKVREQQTIINTFEAIYEGRISIEVKPIEPEAH